MLTIPVQQVLAYAVWGVLLAATLIVLGVVVAQIVERVVEDVL